MEIKLQKRLAKYLFPAISVGALLVTASLLLLGFTSSPLKQSVLVASRDLPVGAKLNASDVHSVQLSLGNLSINYLTKLQPGLVLASSLAKGQLVPKLNLTQEDEHWFPIRLNNLRPIAKSINVGDKVDVWSSKQAQLGTTAPESVAFEAVVTQIENNTSMAQSSTSVELRVSSEYLESLLAAIDSGSQISLILHESLLDAE